MTAIRPREVVTALVTIVVAIGLWEAFVRLLNVPDFLVPAPSAIWQEFASRPDLYANHTWVTLYETVIGFLLAVVLGIVAAIAIVYSRPLQSVVYPLILVLQIVPKVAIAPLLLIWVGYGLQSKALIALLVAFFPIVISAATGMRAADPELLDLVKVLNGSRWQEFVKIRFPYSLPFIFSGLKVAITLAVIGAIIGEFVGGNEGLGYLIVIANAQLRTAMSFSSFILLSLMGLALFAAVVLLERLMVPWGVTEAEEIPVSL
ncbi:MAG TPA: ABC transporter permease [Chloroflexota bacterium]|jgi:NitT/TauT family transport system permease protein